MYLRPSYFIVLWFLLGCGLLSNIALAERDPKSKVSGSTDLQNKSAKEILHRLSDGVESFRLSNGLRILLYRRTHAPVFSAQIWVKVGGVNEPHGRTGVAHLLEHMAFKGSRTIGTKDYEKEEKLLKRYEQLIDRVKESLEVESIQKELKTIEAELEKLWVDNEYATLYQNRGQINLNAATAKDYTMYTVELPNVAFELWCWMESDRLLNPVFRQFYREREVVLEERRTRTDDSPAGKLYEALLATAYWMHPNRLPVIGWPSDVHKLRTADIINLYETYYRPDNMVIALVGDLDSAQVRPLLEKYFSRLPRRKDILPEVRTIEEVQRGERRATVLFDAEPQMIVAFHKPVYPNPDDLYFSVIHSVLSDGRSSILNKELVQEKQIATQVSTSEAPGELFPSLFFVYGIPAKGITNDRLLTEVQQILDRLKVTSVSPSDLEAAKKRVRVGLLHSLTENEGLATTLAHAELLWGDWQVLFNMYDTVLSTTAEDIQRIAKTYFQNENRTVVFLEKTTPAQNTQIRGKK